MEPAAVKRMALRPMAVADVLVALLAAVPVALPADLPEEALLADPEACREAPAAEAISARCWTACLPCH